MVMLSQSFTDVWHSFVAWLMRGSQPLPMPSIVTPIVTLPVRKKPVLAPIDPKEVEENGQFYFKGSILDKLDEYFVILRRLKKVDRQSYDVFSKIGIGILPSANIYARTKLDLRVSPWFAKELPGLGAVAWGVDPSIPHGEYTENGESFWRPRFAYFKKYSKGKHPSEVQRVKGGTVYVLTFYWDVENQPKFKPGLFEVPIVVMDDGSLVALKSKAGKRRVSRYGGAIHSGRDWDFPSQYYTWARDNKLVPEFHLPLLFKLCADSYEENQAAVMKVVVEKDNLTATFGIDTKRSAYFFKDRETVVNDAGSTARIFHIVRPHVRANGSTVKLHFRGLRQFKWNGYDVAIIVPGKFGGDLTSWDVGVADEEWLKEGEGEELGKYGKRLKNFMLSGDPGAVVKNWKLDKEKPHEHHHP
jgi:hypothetical protein